MKIALVRRKYSPFGGAERYLGDLAGHLVQAGHEVHIFSAQWPVSMVHPSLILHAVPMVRGQGILELLTFNRNVDRALGRESFDIIQSSEKTGVQDLYHGDDGCHRQYLLQRRLYEPLARWIGIRINPFHFLTLALERRLFESSPTKFFVAISRRGREEILSHYPSAQSKIRVIYNGLELTKGSSSYEKTDPGKKTEKNVLFVGSGFFRKGLFFLIEAMAQLQKWEPVTLTIIGSDNLKRVKRMAERFRVSDRIILVGPSNQVDRYYRKADVLVLPSIYEPFGNVCLEAMAYGLPVVTSRAAGAAEVIVPGKNGWVVDDPAAVPTLTEAVIQALKLDREEVQKTNERILPGFSWDHHLQALTGLYREVLQEKKGGTGVLSPR